MAAKKSQKKPTKVTKKSSGSKKSGSKADVIVEHVKNHLFADVAIPAIVILLLLVLVLVKVPYEATETYTEIETYEEPVTRMVEDTSNPVQKRECTSVPAEYMVTEYQKPYGRPFGLDEYICYAEFKVTPQVDVPEAKWTFRYIFDIGGKEVVQEQTKEFQIAATYEFETSECEKGDILDGEYEFVSGPMVEECEYVTTYPMKEVTVMEEKTRQIQKERIITKYEPLWQKLVGYNRYEKS